MTPFYWVFFEGHYSLYTGNNGLLFSIYPAATKFLRYFPHKKGKYIA